MKQCSRCKDMKPLDEFYKSNITKDGRKYMCKACKAIKAKSERIRNRNRTRAYKTKVKKDRPEMIKAQKSCCKKGLTCKSLRAHHWCYMREFWHDIIYMTPSQHTMVHRFLVYSKEHMLFKTNDGDLLETKQDHLDYLERCKSLGPAYNEVSKVRPDYLGTGGYVHKITEVEFIKQGD